MAEVKPISISASSEDPAFPAVNLLRGAYKSDDERKSWRCLNPGESSAFIIIKYAEPFVISSVEFKNNGSAIVQIEGQNSYELTHFKTLWKSKSVMSAFESQNGKNTDGTYCFLSQDISNLVEKKKWDTLKIVCSQPFSREVQYGLSYVIARTTLPIKEELPDIVTNSAGLQIPPDITPPTGNSSLSNALPTFEIKNEGHVTNTVLSTSVKQETPSTEDEFAGSDAGGFECVVLDEEEEEEDAQDDRNVENRDQGSSQLPSLKHKIANSEEPHSKRSRPHVLFKPFNKLLEGVQIVLSGFVNPERSEIRSRALQMGATYCPYWNENSTHLVCAFLYTPKYHQARGEGLIVTRDWINECFLQRKRLPWRRFALNMSERYGDSPETEIWELLPNSASTSSEVNPPILPLDESHAGNNGPSNTEEMIGGESSAPTLLVPKIEPGSSDSNVNTDEVLSSEAVPLEVIVKTELSANVINDGQYIFQPSHLLQAHAATLGNERQDVSLPLDFPTTSRVDRS